MKDEFLILRKVKIRPDYSVLRLLRTFIRYAIPSCALAAYFLTPKKKGVYHLLFVVSVFLLSFLLAKFLFESEKERKVMRVYGDWTLPLATSLHIAMGVVMIYEIFFIRFCSLPLRARPLFFIAGFFLLILSFLLRSWARRSLDDQWSIHAIGAQRVRRARLVCHGPYRYVRHPVYVSWMVDAVALPLMWGALCTLVFSAAVLIPVYILRAILEERSSVRRLGRPYLRYMVFVGRFFPRDALLKSARKNWAQVRYFR